MKMRFVVLAVVLAVGVSGVGCSKGESGKVDPAPIQKSFASAEASLKAAADKAVGAIKKGDYSGALAQLQGLLANAKLTDEQKKAIQDVVAQLQKALTEAGQKAATEAGKALGEIQKSLPK